MELVKIINDYILIWELPELLKQNGIVIGEKELIHKLKEMKLIMKSRLTETCYSNSQGLMDSAYGDEPHTTRIFVSPKGQEYIIRRLIKNGVNVTNAKIQISYELDGKRYSAEVALDDNELRGYGEFLYNKFYEENPSEILKWILAEVHKESNRWHKSDNYHDYVFSNKRSEYI